MRQLVSGLTLLVAMCLMAPVSDARAPKPSNFTGATVEFRDGDGLNDDGEPDGSVVDRIKSDGRGSYVDGGQRGLEVRMWINGSQDLTIGTFSSGRTLHFDYRFSEPDTALVPKGMVADNAFVAIRDIAAMGIGFANRRTTKASFNTSIGYFRWLGSPIPATGVWTGDDAYGSQAVIVERTSQHTWQVNTPVPSETFDADPDYTAGDLNVLLKSGRRGELTRIGNYHMAFGLTVTCTTCP